MENVLYNGCITTWGLFLLTCGGRRSSDLQHQPAAFHKTTFAVEAQSLASLGEIWWGGGSCTSFALSSPSAKCNFHLQRGKAAFGDDIGVS